MVNAPYFAFQNGKNESDPKERQEGCSNPITTDEGSDYGERKGKEALITSAPPPPAKEAPPQAEDIMKWIVEAEQLEGVGRSPSSLLTQQLAQMAVEAGPSTLGGEEPVRRKL